MESTKDFLKQLPSEYKLPFILNNADGLCVCMVPNFFDNEDADRLYTQLMEEIKFPEKSVIRLMGREIPIPRQRTAFGDPGTNYSFSGVTVDAEPWIEPILEIKKRVEEVLNQKYNFCLVNNYRNGKDYIGYHSDDEDDLVKPVNIASVSFGATRKFYLKHNTTKDVVKTELSHGTLCFMLHPTNGNYKHSVPKELKVNKPRLNLTFRRMHIDGEK